MESKPFKLILMSLLCLASSIQASSSSGTDWTDLPKGTTQLDLIQHLLLNDPKRRAISFHDWYYGNREHGIKPHEKQIAEQIAKGRLNLSGLGFADIDGLAQIPGIDTITELHLSHNHLTEIPNNIDKLVNLQYLGLDNNDISDLPTTIGRLPRLSILSIEYNPIRLSKAEIRASLTGDPLYIKWKLSPDVRIKYKNELQEMTERELFNAIKDGDLGTVRTMAKAILSGSMTMPSGMVRSVYAGNLSTKIDISKIRDNNGDYLLHSVVKALAIRLKELADVSVLSGEAREKQIQEVAKPYKNIFKALVLLVDKDKNLGPKVVEKMLLTRNKAGADVFQATVTAPGGRDNPLVRTIWQIVQTEHVPIPEGSLAPTFAIMSAAQKPTQAIQAQINRDIALLEKKEEKEGKEVKEATEITHARAIANLEKRMMALAILGLTPDEDTPELIQKSYKALIAKYKPSTMPPDKSIEYIEYYKAVEQARNFLMRGR